MYIKHRGGEPSLCKMAVRTKRQIVHSDMLPVAIIYYDTVKLLRQLQDHKPLKSALCKMHAHTIVCFSKLSTCHECRDFSVAPVDMKINDELTRFSFLTTVL